MIKDSQNLAFKDYPKTITVHAPVFKQISNQEMLTIEQMTEISVTFSIDALDAYDSKKVLL